MNKLEVKQSPSEIVFKSGVNDGNQNVIQAISSNFMNHQNTDIYHYINKWTLRFKNYDLQNEYQSLLVFTNKTVYFVTLLVILSLTILHNITEDTFFIEYTFYYCFLLVITLIQWKIRFLQPYMLSVLQLSGHAGFFYFYSQYGDQVVNSIQSAGMLSIPRQSAEGILLGFKEFLLSITQQNSLIITSMQNNNVILQECNPEAAAKNKIHDLKDFDQFISSLRVEKKLCDNNSSISKTKKGINFQTTFKDFLVEFFYRRQRVSQNRVRLSIQSQGGLNVSTIQSCETVYARRIYDGLEDTTLYKIQCFFMRTDQPFVGISITDAIQQNQNSNINNDSILLTRNKQVSVFSYNGGGSGGGGSVNETKTNCLNYIHYTIDKLNKVIQMMVQEKIMEEHKLAGYEYLNSNTLQNITNITEIGNQLQSILIYCSSPSSGHIAQKKEYLNIIEYLKNIFFCMRQHVFILNNFESIEDYQVYTDPYLLKFILYSIVLNIYSNLNQQRQSFSTQNQESSTQINNTNQELKKITIEYSVNEDMSKIRIGSPIRLTGDLLFGKLNNNIEFNGIEKSVIQDVAVIIQGKREIVTEQVEDQKLQRLFNRNLETNQSDIGATVYVLELPNHLNLMKKNESFMHQNRKNIDHSLLDSANLQDYCTTKPFFQMQPCQQNVQKKLLFNRTSKRYVENLERLITPECYRGKVGSKCNQSFSIESKKLGETLSVSQSRQDRQTQDYNLSLKQLTSTRFHQDELTNQVNSQKIQTTSNRLISLLKPTTVGSSENLEMDNSDDQEYSNINKVYNFEEKKKEIQIM